MLAYFDRPGTSNGPTEAINGRLEHLLGTAGGYRVRGMRALIDALVQAAQREGMELYGVHVYRRGAEPVERRLRSDDRVNLYSVAKTFVSVALGIAEAEGRLTLDDPALDYYPELRPSAAPGLDQVTLRHLLTMTSGSPHSWFANEPVQVPDLAADFFATPAAGRAGHSLQLHRHRPVRRGPGTARRDWRQCARLPDAAGLLPARHS